jgi:DNA-binding protein Fis
METQLLAQLAQAPMELHDLKLKYIYAVIQTCNGNRNKAAKLLGLTSCTVYRIATLYGWTEFSGRKAKTPKAVA